MITNKVITTLALSVNSNRLIEKFKYVVHEEEKIKKNIIDNRREL